MKFTDAIVNRTPRYSLGIEEETGKYYLSIPVANRLCDYDEYYEISPEQFTAWPENREEIELLAQKCKLRENNSSLIVQPGQDRGVAT